MPQATLDSDTKQLLGEVKAALGEQSKISAAVQQLEDEMRGLPRTIENKIKAIKSVAYDPRNGRYRGLFASEDQARSFGLFVMAKAADMAWAADALKSEFPDTTKAFTSANAGNLIPDEYTGNIIDMIESYGVFERNAMPVPMSGSIQRYSKKTARGAAVPMGEGTTISETKPTLADKALTARKWGAYSEIPNEVGEDSAAAIGEIIAMDMAEAFALAADQSGFLGDGTGTYNSITGVINALITEAVVTGSGVTWSELTEGDFLQAISVVTSKTFQGNNAKWYFSHQFYWTVVVPIILAKGGVTAAEMEGRRSLMAFGFPVELTQVMPVATAEDTICAVFGNLRMGAAFGSRRRLEVKQSEHFKFSSDMTAILGTRRFDIQVHGAGTGSTVEVLAGLKTDVTP